MTGHVRRSSNAFTQTALQILSRDTVRIIRRRSKGDGKVAKDRIKHSLSPSVSERANVDSVMAHLRMLADIPFHHDHVEHGKDHHEVSRVLLCIDQVGDADDKVTAHALERWPGQLIHRVSRDSHIPSRCLAKIELSSVRTTNRLP